MGMGSRGRREAENAIASCRPFKNSTGSFYGTRGPTRNLGRLEQHNEARRIRELLSRAVYVVWSYNTPISFVSETEDGERTAYYVEDHHSMTTSHHQSVTRLGMREYAVIGDESPARRPSRQRPVDQAAIDRANARTAEYAESARREPTPAHVYAATANLSPRRDTNGPDFIAPDQDAQRDRLAALLDPRFANPDWTPWGLHGGLPEGADERDAARVEREGTWTP